MRIATYCITFPEERDVVKNMINQAKKLGDVWLIDGGTDGSQCITRTPDLDELSIAKIAVEFGVYYVRLDWPGNPGTQRNRALSIVEAFGYDWIIQNDSDELWTNEAIKQIPSYLSGLPGSVTNVLVKVLPLVGDEKHYSKAYAHHLVHGRIHRPGTVKWREHWHEHQEYTGERVKSDLWLVHTNWLFENRLKRMKGHGLEAWGDLNVVECDLDLSWQIVEIPSADRDRLGK